MKYLILALVLLNFGCATVIQPGPDRISVDSKPEGAKIFLDDKAIGVTPMVVEVPRDSEGVFRIEKDGYTSVIIDRDKVMSGWVFGNIILGGIIGMGVDLATHSQGHYSSDPINVNMNKVTHAPASYGLTH